MSKTRLFIDSPLDCQKLIELNPEAAHYLKTVLRMKVDDELIVFNGQGGEYTAKITEIGKKSVTLFIEKFVNRNPESPLDICLAQGISRGEKMDFTIQKAVELGVNKIVPLLTERCNVKLDAERLDKKVNHWQAVAISAAEQSGRTVVPKVMQPLPLSKWLDNDHNSAKFLLAPDAKITLKMLNKKSITSLTLLIGPEGGLSENEIIQAINKGYTSISLGPRILRTETAGLAAISILQSHFGDLF